VDGKIFNLIDHVCPPAYFRPNGLPFYAVLGTNVAMENHFHACLFCGFIWAKLDNQELQRLLSKSRLPHAYTPRPSAEMESEGV
jgi:hypothetical protein